MGQRGKLKALAGICHVHESYFYPGGSLVFLAEVCFPRRPHAVLPRSQVLSDTSSAITRKFMLSFQTSDRGWPASGRLERQTSAETKTFARLKITLVDMTYPKGWTGSLPLCPLIFSCPVEISLFPVYTKLPQEYQ